VQYEWLQRVGLTYLGWDRTWELVGFCRETNKMLQWQHWQRPTEHVFCKRYGSPKKRIQSCLCESPSTKNVAIASKSASSSVFLWRHWILIYERKLLAVTKLFWYAPTEPSTFANSRVRLPSSPTDVGSSALKLFSDISSSFKLLRPPIDQGMVPVNLHPGSWRTFSSFRLPISSGMLPLRPFCL